MHIRRRTPSGILTTALILAIAAIFGAQRANAATTFTIGGALAGLKAKESVTLFDNGGNSLKLTANGAFKFSTALATGKAYKVTVSVQPVGQLCTVTAGAGKVASANITNVKVACANTYSIGGTVSGLLAKESVTLTDNTTDVFKVSANGKFTFKKELLAKAAYLVKVSIQPVGEVCTVTKGSGKVAAANITNVAVSCAKLYSVGGSVSGLAAKESVTLTDNITDIFKVSASGKFTFKKELPSKAAYLVKVSVQPTGQTCTVTAGSGKIATANITNVAVACKANTVPTYSVGGIVSGLGSGLSVKLANASDSDSVTVAANGSFAFPKKEAKGAAYSVSVTTQPTGQTCAVAGGSGTVASANISSIIVTCTVNSTPTYSIGGAVTGLSSGTVTLLDNGGNSTPVSSNTAFTFSTKIASGKTYAVTVGTQPTGQTCTVTNGSGTVASTNITNVAVACKANTVASYSIGGAVTGLVSGSVTLLDNGGNSTVINSNESFVFTTEIASGSKYAVTVGTQPNLQTCTVTNGSGTVANADVNNVTVTCKPNTAGTFSIGGNVSGLTSGTVTLLNNGGDAKSLTANGAFTFATKLSSATPYSVTVGTQPTGQTCAVTNSSGTVNAANITNVAVACTKNSGTGGGAGHYWLPYNASPTNSASDGQTGLFLIASDKITTSPAPQFVTSDDTNQMSISYDIGVGPPITLTPSRMMYSDTNASGVTHIYGLKLDDTTTFPTPVQISNLALSSTQTICSDDEAQTDLSDPTSIFAVIQVGDAPDCGTTSTIEVIHYKDSSTTAPEVVSLDSTGFDTQYNGGTLVGLLHLNDTTSNLDLYADNTFTSPTHLVSNVQFYETIDGTKFNLKDPFNSKTNLFLNLNTTNATDPTGLYYLPLSSTTVSKVHVGTIGDNVTDDNNLYFEDVSSKTQTLIYQVPLGNGTVKLLYTGTTGTVTTSTSQTNTSDDLIGSNDSVVLFQQSVRTTNLTPPYASTSTGAFFTVPVGASTTAPKQIGSTYTTTGVSGFLASPSGTGLPDSKLFVTLENITVSITGPSPVQTVSFSSLVLPLDGSSNPTPTANSYYGNLGLSSALSQGGVWRATGITDTTGGFGGATVNQTDVDALTDSPFKTTGGGNFVLTPKTYNGYLGYLIILASDGTGPGAFINTTGDASASNIGAAVDGPNNFVYPILIKDTDVQLF